MTDALVRQVGDVSLETQTRYEIRRRFWSVFERTFRVFTADGQLIMRVDHPVFRLREEFTVFGDEARTRPLLKVKSRQVVAINFCYEVVDEATGAVLGSVQKRGLKSLVRDKFLILDHAGNEIGYAEEQGASVARRFFPFLTSKHAIFVGGQQVAFIRQIFTFFTKRFEVTVVPGSIDTRFVLSCALLALMAEARRESR